MSPPMVGAAGARGAGSGGSVRADRCERIGRARPCGRARASWPYGIAAAVREQGRPRGDGYRRYTAKQAGGVSSRVDVAVNVE